MDDIKLLGLLRAEFKRAEIKTTLSNIMQIVILISTVFSVIINKLNFSYIIAIVNLILGFLWIIFQYQAKDSHSTAEQARRAVVFRNGLGIKLTGKSYSDLILSFKVSDIKGKKFEDEKYFDSTEAYGNKKLAEIVGESVFWSKCLFKKAGIKYWIAFIIALFISIIGLLVIHDFRLNQNNDQVRLDNKL